MSAAGARPKTSVIIFWIYSGLLVIATHIPNDSLPPIKLLWFDKFEHFSAYGLWTLLLFWSGLLGPGPFRARGAKALLWSSLFAVTDELLQMIPVLNRVADPLDVVADVIGSVCAVCAVWVWERRLKSLRGQG